jgi:hypothetical protein
MAIQLNRAYQLLIGSNVAEKLFFNFACISLKPCILLLVEKPNFATKLVSPLVDKDG